jgi:hypothetical protein
MRLSHYEEMAKFPFFLCASASLREKLFYPSGQYRVPEVR